MKTKKYHRRYPDTDWDYKAISTLVNDGGTKKEVIYYTLKTKGTSKQGVEIYSGPNYVSNSTGKSYSRSYSLTACPAKYKSLVQELKKVYSKTKWSSAKKVNEN